MTKDASERRRRGRVPVSLAVKVCLAGEEMTVASRNLSLKGLACAPDPRLVENACCRVVISLAPGLQTVIKGRIIRADEAGAAIDFLAMDPESFVHLKKIVEYHSPNPEELTRELLTPAFPLFRSPTPFVGRKPRK